MSVPALLPVPRGLHLGVELLLDDVVILCFIAWFLTVCVQCNRARGSTGGCSEGEKREGERARDPINPALITVLASVDTWVSTWYSLNP